MVNCNPETVSTDYVDLGPPLLRAADRRGRGRRSLDAERAACARRRARSSGVIVTLGGQTPLKLSHAIDPALVLGTPPDAIDLAEDRERWSRDLPVGSGCASRPAASRRRSTRRARWRARSATRCWCGRATCSAGARWRSSTTTTALARVMDDARPGAARRARPRGRRRRASGPILIDRFLEDAIEVDVDAVRDARRRRLRRGGHGARRGGRRALGRLGLRAAAPDARRGGASRRSPSTRGAIAARPRRGRPAQRAVRRARTGEVFVLEANPRASRTVPFVAKATGRRAWPGWRLRGCSWARPSPSCAPRGSCPTPRPRRPTSA